MKLSQILYCIIFLITITATSELKAQLTPTKTKAVVTFVFKNPVNKNPVVGKEFKVEGKKSKLKVDLKTDAEGKASVLVPVNDLYLIHLPSWDNFGSVGVPEGEYQRHEIPVDFFEVPADGSPILLDIPVHIQLLKDDGTISKLEEEITIRSGNTKKEYRVKTDKNGKGVLNLPVGGQFVLSLEGAPNYYKFEIPNKPYAAWKEDVLFERIEGMDKYPSMNKGLINLVFYDLNKKLVADEPFWVISKKDGKTYRTKTNQQGIAQLLVPLNDIYALSTAHNIHFGTLEMFLSKGSDILVETITYESVSSKDWELRQNEQEYAAFKRDSIVKSQLAEQEKMLDSLRGLALEENIIADLIKYNRPIPINKTFTIRKAVHAKVKYVEEQIKINPNHFIDNEKPILAILHRFKESWKGKVVVTDITQSMNPYLEEVLIWHSLTLRKGEHTKYLFFNDGDRKMASAKKIGSTGGIYHCEGAWEELPLVISTMQTAMDNGLGGGEAPENDLEAVLQGIKQGKQVEEVVLIADSYSRVRDMELLNQIQIPVRVILCGAEEGNGFYRGMKADINEEYLTIAHRTKGSIHTLREDVLDLSERKEGEVVEIGEHRYVLRNKQFIKLM